MKFLVLLIITLGAASSFEFEPSYPRSVCDLDRNRGQLCQQNYTKSWFFDKSYGDCLQFWYGGCGGNGNQFKSKAECKDVCVYPKGKEVCYLPKIAGPCDSYNSKWYYDSAKRQCDQFTYGGCLGNDNKFNTKHECEKRCWESADTVDTGNWMCYKSKYCPADISNDHKEPPKTIACASGYKLCYETKISATPKPPDSNKCGVRKIEDKFAKHPWFVTFFNSSHNNSHIIRSGVLIDDKHVLTAAHKVANFEAKPWELEVLLSSFSKTVRSISLHPGYDSDSRINNIAVVKLEESLDLNESEDVTAACLITRVPNDGTRCYVPLNSQGAPFKYYSDVKLPILDGLNCEKKLKKSILGNNFSLQEGWLCAGGEPEKDTCDGDAGAPLVCEENGRSHLAGLFSSNIGCDKNVGIYMNVSYYLPWINRAISTN